MQLSGQVCQIGHRPCLGNVRCIPIDAVRRSQHKRDQFSGIWWNLAMAAGAPLRHELQFALLLLSRFQKPRFEKRSTSINHDTATKNGFSDNPSPVFELQPIHIDAAADRHAKHTKLRVGPPFHARLAVVVANHGRTKSILCLCQRRILAAATTVAM